MQAASHAGPFFMHLCHLRIIFFEKLFQKYHQSVKRFVLDPDQDRYFVGPDLGSNCLKRLSAQTALVGKELTLKPPYET